MLHKKCFGSENCVLNKKRCSKGIGVLRMKILVLVPETASQERFVNEYIRDLLPT
jgi:hypothetical protein